MIRTQNGTWMDPRFVGRMKLNLQQFAEGGEGGTGDAGSAGGEGGTGGETGTAGGEGGTGAAGTDPAGNGGNAGDNDPATQLQQMMAKVARLEAEAAKNKAALDKATHEAAENRRALKAKMTQEEIDAANKKEAEEKVAQELEDLRRKVSKAENTKAVMGKLNVDEETAGQIAESMAGCDSIENALLLIQKAWTAREKALRIEFGKITGPGAGGGSEDQELPEALNLAKELGESQARAATSVRDQLKGLIR